MSRQRGLTHAEINDRLFNRDSNSDDSEDEGVSDYENSNVINPSEIASATKFSIDQQNEMISSSEDEIEENEVRRIRSKPKKKFTKHRKVHDLCSSLDENNYVGVNQATETTKYEVLLSKATRNNPANKITWVSKKPTNVGRTSAENVLKVKPGPSAAFQQALTPIEAWELFISPDIIQRIVFYTNQKINYKNSLKTTCQPYSYPTDEIELKAYIGLRYFRGLEGKNQMNFRRLFKPSMGHQIFSSTMCLSRFQFLNVNICFDDAATRPERFDADRFAAFREIFEMFNTNCSEAMVPDGYLTIDETLYSCRIAVGFKQYNPSKPNRYGILFKSINSVNFPFTHRTVVYAGKPQGTPGQYYVPGINPIVKSLVNGLSEKVCIDGNNITTDRLYTNFELCDWFLSKKITTIGTMMANKKGIPNELKKTDDREHLSYECLWQIENPRISLHSYVVEKKVLRRTFLL